MKTQSTICFYCDDGLIRHQLPDGRIILLSCKHCSKEQPEEKAQELTANGTHF